MIFHGIDGFVGTSQIPESCETSIVARGENGVMEMIPADVFDLVFVEDEVTHGADAILGGFMEGVPNTKFSIVRASSYLPMIFPVPLNGKALSLMSFKDQMGFKLRLSFNVLLLIND